MEVRWTEAAAEDLASIVGYISRDNPESVRRVAEIVFDGVVGLRTFPRPGRVGLADPQPTHQTATRFDQTGIREITEFKTRSHAYQSVP